MRRAVFPSSFFGFVAMEEARDEGARPDQDVPYEEEQVAHVKDVMVVPDDQESDDGSFHADSQSDNECDSEDDDIDEEQNEDNTLRDDIPEGAPLWLLG